MADPHNTPHGTSMKTRSTLRRVRITSWWSIALERAWPRLLPFLLVLSAFAAASWFGLFRQVPDIVRIALGIACACAATAALWPLRGFKKPNALEVDRRLERENNLLHTPITIDQDTIAVDAAPAAQALWKAHKARIAANTTNVSAVAGTTTVPQHDPWALRTLAPLIAVTAFAFSFSPQGGALTDVLVSHHIEAITPMRVDAWISPPGYTAIAPIFLTSDINAERSTYTVPEGSVAKIRLAGGTGEETVRFGGADMVLTEDNQAVNATRARAFEVDMREGGTLSIARGDEALGNWAITITDDAAPTINFADEDTRLQRAANGTWTLNYRAQDDYRLKSAQAVIELANPALEGTRRLYEAPELPLSLPRRSFDNGAAKTTKDLSMHPWAGARIKLTLEADDDLSQIGRSQTIETVLPGRPFSNRLARALVEQRRNLALDANNARNVYETLDMLTLYPEETINNVSHFLGMTTAMQRLRAADTDDKLRDVVDYLWEIARQIEDGNLSEAERRMRQAQQALQDALENGASDEEISQLTDELRQAMQQYMRELAEQARRNPQAAPQNQGQQIQQQSLEEMLDQIEEMAQSGSREQAMDMLQQLNEMMNNLQMAQPQQGQGQQDQSQAQQQMNELGEILREQQELMNETFQQNREGRDGEQQPGQQGQNQQGEGEQPGQQPGQQGRNQAQQGQQGQGGSLEGLAPGQQALQQRLQEFMQGLEDMGLQPGEAFGQAGQAMEGAGEALGDQQGEAALAQQGEAMDALREGAGEMMQQMQQQAQNNGQGSTQPGGNRGANDRDPLGRPQRSSGPDFGESVDIPDEIDVRRAREILEAIRERLGNTLSPQLEKEYLERLLDLN